MSESVTRGMNDGCLVVDISCHPLRVDYSGVMGYNAILLVTHCPPHRKTGRVSFELRNRNHMSYFQWPGMTPSGIDWQDMNSAKASADGASKNIVKRREDGTDNSTFKGMSRKSSELGKKQKPPQMMKAGK